MTSTPQPISEEDKKISKILARFFDVARNRHPWTAEKQSEAYQEAREQIKKMLVEARQLKEVEVRYNIHKEAPPLSNREWQNYDRFIVNIWMIWAMKNKANMLGGKATLSQSNKGETK